MIRRVNLYGGPGMGKSLTAAELYACYGKLGHSVEHVKEVIKLAAYRGEFPKSYQPLKIFSLQIDAEDGFLEHVQFIVTDSPIHLNVAYNKFYGFEGWEEMLSLANKWEAKMPAYHILMKRKWPYQTAGRYQDEKAAVFLDSFISDFVEQHLPADRVFHDLTLQEILNLMRKDEA